MRAEFGLGDTDKTARALEVAVIGAGVVGMATALTLADRGHRVTIVDGADRPGQGTSFANGAQLSYAYTDAFASPSILIQLPKLLLGRVPAFRLHASLDPHFLSWTFAFLKNSSADRFRRNTLEGLALATQSRRALHTLSRRHGLEFGLARPGKLIIYRTAKSFAAARAIAAEKSAYGTEQIFLDADGAVAVEPMLEAVRSQIVGAIHTPGEEVGDPYLFCQSAQIALDRGGQVSHYRTAVVRIETDGRRPAAITAGGLRIEADRLVLCTGADTAGLARDLGIRLPIMPMKGHSITVPIGNGAPHVSVTDAANRVVFAQIGGRMRIAGLADLGRRDNRVEPRRIATLIASAKAALPEAADYGAVQSSWAGLRPMTPNSLPIMRAIAPGVIANMGHGALGWTYAAGSAERIVAIVEGEG